MTRELATDIEGFPIAGVFTISRGSRTEARVVRCTVSENGVSGHGECVPYPRYGESEDSVVGQIEAARQEIANGISRADLIAAMPAGAARNAVDCALWDLEAKLSGKRASTAACPIPPRPLQTAYTISLAEPEEMAAQARAHATRPLLKVKLGGKNDAARIHAVAGAAPDSRLIVDANEGWTEENIRENMLAAAEFHVALIEQPLPAGKDEILREIPHPVPICADESVHTAQSLPELAGLYDFVNIKLDKTGGLTAAMELRDRAREMGFGVMVGCMVGTSLAMAPAVLLAQGADYVDLDGPLLLAKDRAHGLSYSGSLVSPPSPQLWG
ncbi:dipeptide epimerase [Nitratireductor aquimarinus]|uniref:Dipeptide epimerase n=1 Tax=Nitratireductor aquimarinus TaxID=889300 RepID=A0ABU4ARE3_9HYPH|nr:MULTISPECIES: N-acetyl-D-Glu racemase DgcA [Alphaproteobacteria]MBY6020954.1 dipeptide epimerase [Nitratireductor sp. DP7N14-4]MBN7756168.1 dipeptide epimerase [Nitratireductor aquimarinus]MBN7759655.1 dipeptide epimerase [Nitratireductor aquibiodomus]MBN8244610.1 dipeptide epimerase [Nitratireductor aquimarinus]MBY5998926.1 dipeptide epimerase [Tritonibacter mobilis]